MSSSDRILLPEFLKQLTSNNIPHTKAIQIASKIYKTNHTPAALARLTDTSLKSFGIEEKDLRRLTLAAFKKADWQTNGTGPVGSTKARIGAHPKVGDIKSVGSAVLPPTPALGNPKAKASNTISSGSTPPQKRKRSTVDDNELPDRPPEDLESAKCGNFDFKEVLDEGLLKRKSTVINRAPIMTAWAVIVAERLGFEREEALSIASLYTDMNAVSKGVSIGVYNPGKGKESQKSIDGAQPYVDLMGRRIPLYRFQLSDDRSQWRALSSGKAVSPLNAYKYVTNSMKQTTPYILGAMRLLSESFEPEELNQKGFSLYCGFRPDIEPGKSGWGKRGNVPCEAILKLRKAKVKGEGVADVDDDTQPVPTIQHTHAVEDGLEGEEPPQKKSRIDNTDELDELFGD